MIEIELSDEARWQAVVNRNPSFDGQFVYAVSSTKVFCRPSCPSRRPLKSRVSFFDTCSDAKQAGYRPCRRCNPLETDVWDKIIQSICHDLETKDGAPSDLAGLSRKSGMSPFHLQRMFRRKTGLSPREYAQACRAERLKKRLQSGEAVTSALYAAGYGSASRLYEISAQRLGMTPATYGKKGRGAIIHYSVQPSRLGRFILAATTAGICALHFGDTRKSLLAALRDEFSAATLIEDSSILRSWSDAVKKYVEGKGPLRQAHLDIHGTAFQWSVWRHLQTIPRGQSRSYAEVAGAIGLPNGARAVARACASNRVALLIPCHRVLRSDGDLAGYRWKTERKQKLLEVEGAIMNPTSPRVAGA